MILDMVLEVPGQIIDARGQQCDLNFRRARVGLRPLMILQYLSLLARRNRHYLCLRKKGRYFTFGVPMFPNIFRGLIEPQKSVLGGRQLGYQALCNEFSVSAVLAKAHKCFHGIVQAD